jgi:hypothetical protein
MKFVGVPSEYELACLANIRVWEECREFVREFEGARRAALTPPPPQPSPLKGEGESKSPPSTGGKTVPPENRKQKTENRKQKTENRYYPLHASPAVRRAYGMK